MRVWVACRCNMVMPQALAQVTFPVTLQWSLTQLQEPHWLQYVCQLLEMSLTRVMRFEQSKVHLSWFHLFEDNSLVSCCLLWNERYVVAAEQGRCLSIFLFLFSTLCLLPCPTSVPLSPPRSCLSNPLSLSSTPVFPPSCLSPPPPPFI